MKPEEHPACTLYGTEQPSAPFKPFKEFEKGTLNAAKGNQNLEYQMSVSIAALQKDLAHKGMPHILDLIESSPGFWDLYADGRIVAEGSFSGARELFEHHSRAFYRACQAAIETAIKEGKLEPLTPHDFELLKAAERLAKLEGTTRERRQREQFKQMVRNVKRLVTRPV